MSAQRIQLRRTKGWRKPDGAVVVARPSRWGNPFLIGDPSPFTREDAVRMYRDLILHREAWWMDLAGTAYESRHRFTHWHGNHRVPTVGEIHAELAGKALACWCPPGLACHADVLLALANEGTP